MTSASISLLAKSSISVDPFIDTYMGLELNELYDYVTLQEENITYIDVVETFFVPDYNTMGGEYLAYLKF